MKLEIVNVEICDLRALLNDPNAYVVTKNSWGDHKMSMKHIAESDVRDVMSGKNLVVKITG